MRAMRPRMRWEGDVCERQAGSCAGRMWWGHRHAPQVQRWRAATGARGQVMDPGSWRWRRRGCVEVHGFFSGLRSARGGASCAREPRFRV